VKPVSNSLQAFGIYLIMAGLSLAVVPNFILDLFHLSYGNELWMARMVGLLAFILGIYYSVVGKHRLHQLCKPSVCM
jgi:hypothetical protein